MPYTRYIYRSTQSTVTYDYRHDQIPWTDIGRYFGMQSRNCCETFFEASRNLHVWQNQKGEREAVCIRDPLLGRAPARAQINIIAHKSTLLLCHMANVATKLKPNQS